MRIAHYAGLPLPALTALTAAIPRTLGDGWRLEPWMGRMSGDLLIVGSGALGFQARTAGAAALRAVVEVSGVEVADFRKCFATQLPPFAEFCAPRQSPFHVARQLKGLASLLLCGALDARLRQTVHRYRHPIVGSVEIDFVGGWVTSEQPIANVVGVLLDDAWLPGTASSESDHCYSLEAVVWLSVLRWRSVLVQLDSFPPLRITEFPDIASISGQAGLHEAVFAWQQAGSIDDLVARTSVSLEMAKAIAVAAALSGLAEVTPVKSPSAGQAVEKIPSRPTALARLAHFLGLSRATAREFP